mmetsp:Transcript_12158/g.18457  ORF Transcript_12158/g.18457 Transcript_12158/m.18457 type:complete len:214 (+) Transcript_12158:823-1464(+)
MLDIREFVYVIFHTRVSEMTTIVQSEITLLSLGHENLTFLRPYKKITCNPSLFCEIVLELGIYDNLKQSIINFKNRNAVKGEERPGGQLDELLAAAISGGITGFLTSPLDNIKTKLMVDAGYNGFFDCLFKTAKTNGVPSLFAGSAARVAWLMPFTAIYLPVYEIVKRKMAEVPVMPGPLGVKGGHMKNRNMGRAFRRPMQQPYTRYSGSVCF